MSNAVELKKIYFSYGYEEVLKDINLIIQEGAFISILGPNGSGKTTLLKNMCKLLEPLDGKILVDDRDLEKIAFKELAKTMAVVHQDSSINFEFTVFDIVMMGRYPYQKRFRSESEKDINVVKRAMENTETWNLREKSIHEISGGERQRVIIARALAQEPKILLLDEPISQLDIKHQISILNLCKKLNSEEKITIITTLHDINLAARYSDYILLMNKGKIKAFGTPESVLTKENIQDVYGIEVRLIKLNEYKVPYIVPLSFQSLES